MAKKKGWGYFIKVGFHLAVVSIPAMIIAWLVSLPLALIFATAPLLLMLIEFIVGFLIYGWALVKWKDWVFSNKII